MEPITQFPYSHYLALCHWRDKKGKRKNTRFPWRQLGSYIEQWMNYMAFVELCAAKTRTSLLTLQSARFEYTVKEGKPFSNNFAHDDLLPCLEKSKALNGWEYYLWKDSVTTFESSRIFFLALRFMPMPSFFFFSIAKGSSCASRFLPQRAKCAHIRPQSNLLYACSKRTP
jgi:hypothetical protein